MADGKKDTALGLGERLRSARKARALTLEQAAFTLKMDISILRALEDERFDALGAPVFVRGHLKAYARILGLSEEAVLEAYRAADPGSAIPPKVTREIEKPLTTSPGPLAIMVGIVLALIVMGLIYILGSGSGSIIPPAMTPPSSIE
ncbi:MAG: helix-turn-helix domain-containing protein [Gammaproteobacteria bacterium]